MMRLALMAALTIELFSPASAQAPVAIVEDVDSSSARLEFMDYVAAGKVIRLGASDRLVLGYLSSCWRENIIGGTVTVGAEQSTVTNGKIDRVKVQCDGGRMQLTSEQASKSGAMSFRKMPKKDPQLPQAAVTIYGLSPTIELRGGGHLVIERLDLRGEKIELEVPATALTHAAFYDLSKAGKVLAPGGLYLASVREHQIVFKVDPRAKPGQAPVIGRLLRLVPAG
jgi:hypothetical protein